MTLIDLILNRYENSIKWNGDFNGMAGLRIEEKHYKDVDKHKLIMQAKVLEGEKLIKITWVKGYFNYDIEKITYSLSNLPLFYDKARRIPKYEIIQQQSMKLNACAGTIKSPWIRAFMLSELIEPLKKGKVLKEESKTELLCKCLMGLDELNGPVFKRVFSKRYLNNSKTFEKELEGKIVKAAKKYNSSVEEDMDDTSILSQIFIEEYSQELYVKGSLKVMIEEKVLDTGLNPYGMVLNSQTIKNAVILKEQTIRRILTIENKANFISEPYEEGTLILFTHGYFTPLERNFLIQLRDILNDKDIIYHHSGDMDYGGIRIFHYIRTRIFPDLKPYLMDGEVFHKYLSFAEPIEAEKLEKLVYCDEPLLKEVIDCIQKYKMVLEQEAYL